MILKPSDFYTSDKLYRIPQAVGASQQSELLAAIAEAEYYFLKTFDINPVDITAEQMEALKYYTFAVWLNLQITAKTASGQGAVNNLKEARNELDRQRLKAAYNHCAEIMDCEKLDSFFNI